MKFTKEFTDAVEQKNRLRVRIMLKDAFLLDKTGDTFDKMEQYAAERMPELYEAHDEEILLKLPEQWTIDYFNDQMVKVVGNFSRERVALLKKMVAALFGEKTETSAPERGKLSGGIWVAAGVVLVVIMLLVAAFFLKNGGCANG